MGGYRILGEGGGEAHILRYVEVTLGKEAGKGEGEGGSFVACLGHLTMAHAFLSRGGTTAPTPDRDTFNIWTLSTFLTYITVYHKGRMLLELYRFLSKMFCE